MSHSWSSPFHHVADAVLQHLRGCDEDATHVWLALFATNLHDPPPPHAQLATVKAAAGVASATLVCLDPACSALGRLRCLHEMGATLSSARSPPADLFWLSPGLQPTSLVHTVRRMSVEAAGCSEPGVRDAILADLDAMFGGTHAFLAQLKLALLLRPHGQAACSAGVQVRLCYWLTAVQLSSSLFYFYCQFVVVHFCFITSSFSHPFPLEKGLARKMNLLIIPINPSSSAAAAGIQDPGQY